MPSIPDLSVPGKAALGNPSWFPGPEPQVESFGADQAAALVLE